MEVNFRIIRNYIYSYDREHGVHSVKAAQHVLTLTDPYTTAEARNYDLTLHQLLTEIIGERRLTSDQMKKLLRDQSSVIEPILDEEPIVSSKFGKEELKEIPLLWIAVLADYKNSAELLINSGAADVNELFGRHNPQVIDEKWTVLHVLLQMNDSPRNERLIRLIMNHGADLQARDSYERTAFHFAVMRDRVQLIETFLEKEADDRAAAADRAGDTPVTLAAKSHKADELLPLFMKHRVNISAETRSGKTLLHLLAWSSSDVEHLARAFIDKGMELNERDEVRKFQPIHEAAEKGNNKLVNLYLDHGADINARAPDDEFPLNIAARHGNDQVVKTLLERGANIKLKTFTNSRTALHSACEIRENLLDRREYTPQDYTRQDKCIKLLLLAGADFLAEDRSGYTPLAVIASRRSVIDPQILRTRFELIVKALALKKVCQPSIELKDERIITGIRMWGYYRDCIVHICRMKFTRLIKTCTFLDLLTKDRYQIARLIRNPDFEANFELYDLNGFLMYAEDVREALERAQNDYRFLLEKEEVINEAFYHMLPELVTERVACYIFYDCYKNVK